MQIDPTYLVLSLLFTAAGIALFIYGKKAKRPRHQTAGIAMMVCPYFVSNAIVMSTICVLLAVVPFCMPKT